MAENLSLTIDSGTLTYDVKDTSGEKIGEIRFNPADVSILERIDSVVDFFNGVTFSEELTHEQTVESVKKLNSDIKEQFDFMLGAPVSEGLFAKVSPLAMTDTGLFFENCFDAVVQLAEATLNQRVEKKLKKSKKAVQKYHK